MFFLFYRSYIIIMNKYFNKVMQHFCDKKPKIHFIGIGGIGMSALAGICLGYGYKVSGSDLTENENIKQLKNSGAEIILYHSKENIKDCDIVVHSTAIKPDNPELMQAVKNGKCVLERHKFLGVIFNCYQKSIAVSGSHGKTTACGILTHILMEAQADPQILIGGNLKLIGGNFRNGKGCCLAEACEYKRNFLSLKPLVSVVLNVENDHMDYYSGLDDLMSAYNSFLQNTKPEGYKIINGDDKICNMLNAGDCITYGFDQSNMCRAINIKKYRGKYSFTISYKEKEINVRLSVYGKHNIYNALASYLAASAIGIEDSIIVKGIKSYNGISRRFECSGRLDGAAVINDYAHHPSEIKAVIDCAKDIFKGAITVVFQPHTYSRTKALINDFVKCFDGCDSVILLPVYAARESYDSEGSSAALYEKLKMHRNSVIYLDSFNQAEMYLRRNKPACVLVLGAGDIDKLAEMLTR